MNKRARFTFWDLLLWLGAAIILIWVLLKMIGVISSPLWIEMLPYLGGGISIVGGACKLGKIMRGIEITNKKVNSLLVMKEDVMKLKYNQELCLSGKLKNSPYKS